jgi:hypothetical protein
MERRMMQGIKDRAEGNLEPESIEVIEIALWLLALAAGLAGAVLFVRKSAWPLPLLVATGAVLALLVFTFLQPPIWIRVVVDAALLGGLAVFVLANRLIPADRLQ